MRNLNDRDNFIKLRAEGKSYRQIADELGIAKATCSNWEKEYKDKIQELKADRIEELYNAYFMTKEARIQKIGDTLNKINDALEKADLTQVSPERLLDFKLKYTEALKGEYIGTDYNTLEDGFNAKDILNNIGNLLNRLKSGTVTPEQATKEGYLIMHLLKAYEGVEITEKVALLENVLTGRKI